MPSTDVALAGFVLNNLPARAQPPRVLPRLGATDTASRPPPAVAIPAGTFARVALPPSPVAAAAHAASDRVGAASTDLLLVDRQRQVARDGRRRRRLLTLRRAVAPEVTPLAIRGAIPARPLGAGRAVRRDGTVLRSAGNVGQRRIRRRICARLRGRELRRVGSHPVWARDHDHGRVSAFGIGARDGDEDRLGRRGLRADPVPSEDARRPTPSHHDPTRHTRRPRERSAHAIGARRDPVDHRIADVRRDE